METFTGPKRLSNNPRYPEQRQKCLAGLEKDAVDGPIVDIIRDFNSLPYCFTLQSCYGHFVTNGRNDPRNTEPLPDSEAIVQVEYRIAYIAFCIENSGPGRRLHDALQEIPIIDPENIQFGSAEWFWKRQVNSYALQVEPDRFKHKDSVRLGYAEALRVEKIRNIFFDRIRDLLQAR